MKKRRRKPIRRLNNAMKKRTIFACAFIALLFVILIGRLVYFSVFKNNIYKRQTRRWQFTNAGEIYAGYCRGDRSRECYYF